MVPVLLVLLLALILFGAGFALKALWWIAVAVLVVWLLGFLMRSSSGGTRAVGTAGDPAAGPAAPALAGPARGPVPVPGPVSVPVPVSVQVSRAR